MTERERDLIAKPKLRAWPIVMPRFQRCASDWIDERDEFRQCQRLLWPWQDVVRDWDPECGGPLMHHECYHRRYQTIFGRDGEVWTEWIHCEHRTDRL